MWHTSEQISTLEWFTLVPQTPTVVGGNVSLLVVAALLPQLAASIYYFLIPENVTFFSHSVKTNVFPTIFNDFPLVLLCFPLVFTYVLRRMSKNHFLKCKRFYTFEFSGRWKESQPVWKYFCGNTSAEYFPGNIFERGIFY